MSPRGRETSSFPPRVKPTAMGRYPALSAAACLMAGIILHEYAPILIALWLAVAFFMALASLISPWHAAGNFCIAIAIGAAGLAAGQLARFAIADDHLALYLGDSPRVAWMEIRIDETPRLLRTSESAIPRPPKQVSVAQVMRIAAWDGWRDCRGPALLQFDSPCPDVRAGDRLRVFGLIERPGEAMNPGQFDFAAYYRASGVLGSISIDGPATVTLIQRGSPSLLTRARQQVTSWLDAGFDSRQQEQSAILRALLFGQRDPVMNDAREAFRRTGTSHHLAISGLHIAIIGGLVFGLVRLLGGGPRTSVIAGGITIAIYGMLALPSAPVIRATVLALTFGIGLLFGRRTNGLQLLGVAAVFVLLINPLDLYRAGFQLTFVTVAGLMLFATPLRRAFSRAAGAGDAELLRGSRDHPLLRITHWIDGRMLKAVAAAAVAWGIAMPLVAVHFEQFNPWAIPASLASAPFVFLSLAVGVLKVLLTALMPGQSELWADIAAAPVTAMLGVIRWFAALPGADVPLPRPPLPLLAIFYGGALFWLLRFPAAGLTWLARSAAPVAALFIFILPYASTAPVGEQPLRVTVLAVGAGQCIVIETPGGRIAMIDCGSTSLGDVVEKCVAPFLRSRGHTQVDLLVLSHANWDHYGGAAELAGRYGAAEVVVAANFEADARAFASGRRMLDELVHQDRPPRIARAGDVLPLGRQSSLRVIWPPADGAGLSSNDGSLVLRLEHAGGSMLLAGDIQEEGLRRLLALAREDSAASPRDAGDARAGTAAPEYADWLKADVLLAPHHGSSEVSTGAFVAAVDPQWIISSNGRVLSQKQRRFVEVVGIERCCARTRRGR